MRLTATHFLMRLPTSAPRFARSCPITTRACTRRGSYLIRLPRSCAGFRKFKACINVPGVNERRRSRDAINIIYKSLQEDVEKADISDIIRQLHAIVETAIAPKGGAGADTTTYDISKIDFDLLRREFERAPAPKTTVQNLRQAVENRLQRLLRQNPLRTDFQKHYEEIVDGYNREKDRLTIEKTFQALLSFVQELDAESSRAIREGLDEESLAIFDLLKKPHLPVEMIPKIKKVASDLLAMLKAEKLRIDQWREKESTRDAVRLAIRDFLWGDETGLPVTAYTEEDVQSCAEEVFRHVYRAYPRVPSPIYQAVSA